MQYVTSTNKKVDGCVFCAKLSDGVELDRQNYVIFRGRLTITVLNIYPYTTGHLMVLPCKHVAALADVPQSAQVEMMLLASYFTDLLAKAMAPDGFNVGINIGRAAGAGIDSHLHMHIVPRWSGDNNFMAVVGETRVLPEKLEDTYDRIVAALERDPPNLP